MNYGPEGFSECDDYYGSDDLLAQVYEDAIARRVEAGEYELIEVIHVPAR